MSLTIISGDAPGFTNRSELVLQACPTTATTVTTSTVRLLGLTLVNTTTLAPTFILSNGLGSPTQLWSTVAVAPNSIVVANTPYGITMQSGFSIQASATGINVQALWDNQ